MGWTAGDGSQLPGCGAWPFERPQPHEIGLLIDLFDRQLNLMIDRFRPEALAFEKPILVHKSKWTERNDRLEDVSRTLAMTGHVEFVCHRRGIDCYQVDLRDVKKELAGFSAADKDDMIAAALKVGLALPASPKRAREDAADAFGVWLLLLRRFSPLLSQRFDSALWGSRGLLF